MKFQTLYKHIFFQLILFGTLGFVYAAWNDTVSTSDTLTAARWNNLVAQVEDTMTPSGMVAAFNGACPTGWSAFSAADGRVIVGVGTLGVDTYNLSDTGGSATHTLSEAEIPSHSHTVSLYGSDGVANSPTIPGNALANQATNTYASRGSLDQEFEDGSVIVDSTGDGQAHENRPPYIALTYCEKD